jgi:uncharacterized membrane protein
MTAAVPTLAYWHLATVLPAFVIGSVMLLRRKGTQPHRALGRVFMLLMAATAAISLCMPAQVGPQWLGHFGFIHAFSLLTLYLVPTGWLAARRGDIRVHRGRMVGLYVGGLVIAGGFAFMPGRLMHTWLWGVISQG